MLLERLRGVTVHGERDDVVLLADERDVGEAGLAGTGEPYDPPPAAAVQVLQLAADPRLGQPAFDDADAARRVDPLGTALVGQQPSQRLVGGPLDRRHGGDAEPLVDARPLWV